MVVELERARGGRRHPRGELAFQIRRGEDRLGGRGQLVELAEPTTRLGRHPGRGEPRRRSEQEQRHRFERAALRGAELAEPLVGLRLRSPEEPERLSCRATPDPTLRTLRGRTKIAAGERLIDRRPIPHGCTRQLAATLEVLREHHRVHLAGVLQPLAGEAMPEPQVRVGEHRVRGLADDRVPELILVLVGEPRLADARDQLA